MSCSTSGIRGDAGVVIPRFDFSFEVKRLRDEREPYKNVLNKEGTESRKLDCDAYICIYDVFGFFQTSFVKAVGNLVKLGYTSGEDLKTVELNKKKRHDFASVDFAQIKALL